jgi:flagellar basal-body rod protein FlgB
MGLHTQALKLHTERAKVLASNIANESTPGYQARDIDFAAALRNAQSDDVTGLALDTGESELKFRVPNHPSADGNTVELGAEQAAFAQNSADFQTSLTFISMKIKGLAKAIAGV